MHILNHVIAAGALVVPMTLGAAGVAMADVAAGSSAVPTQIEAPNDHNSDFCRHEEDGSHGSLGSGNGGFLGLLGGGNSREKDSHESECQRDDNGGHDNNGPLS